MKRRNGLTLFASLSVVACMVGLSFASVPLYRLFCQVTGLGGTTQVAARAPDKMLDRVITVRFNADVNSGLDWKFQPVQREIKVRLGEEALAFYVARNNGAAQVTGTATFNVTPLKAGAYFNKIDCFCFTEQRLAAGRSADLPVAFFVDPDLAKDRNLDDVTTITLSYTFFKALGTDEKDPKTAAKTDKSAALTGGRAVN